MPLDSFLPDYDVWASYHADVLASAGEVYAVARRLDLGGSTLARLLFRLRGLPPDCLSFDGMLRHGFVLLADEPCREIVFGLAGRFWTLPPLLARLSPEDFTGFDQPGFAKAAGMISIMERGDGQGVRVITETRVKCLCIASRRRFGLYWALIRPFSGLIRKAWLNQIKIQAEAEIRPG